MLITTAFFVPAAAMSLVAGATYGHPQAILGFFLSLGGSIAVLIGQAALVIVLVAALTGSPVAPGAASREAAGAVPTLLVAYFVLGIAVSLPIFLVALVLGHALVGTQVLTIGTFAMVIVLVPLQLVVPIIVEEDAGAFDALIRAGSIARRELLLVYASLGGLTAALTVPRLAANSLVPVASAGVDIAVAIASPILVAGLLAALYLRLAAREWGSATRRS